MNKYLLIRKKWSNIDKGIVVAEQLIEADGMSVIEQGTLVFFDSEAHCILACPVGSWLEVEKIPDSQWDESMRQSGLVTA